jgi:xanthine dehydrogenase molybdenum-binding subunit
VFPFGGMGIAEPAMTPSGPAVQMALYNAIGIEILEYPFTPQNVLKALREHGINYNAKPEDDVAEEAS